MEALLTRLGLRGAYQVHVGPIVLQPDQRAHQIFTGFDAPDAVKALISERYHPGIRVDVLCGDRRSSFSLSEDWLWPEGSVAVVPAVREDHPGGFYGLVWLMDRLLGPGGCPWDQEQTHSTLKRYLIEESYELLDAIDEGDETKMVEELGDVLLQPVFHAQMEARDGKWSVEAPIKAISDKLVRRHPHVFGDTDAANADEVLKNWDLIKSAEKKGTDRESILSGVPKSLPSLLRAYEVSKRAARTGFEWPDVDAVWQKVREEEAEFLEALAENRTEDAADELGDLLFTIVNVARWAGIEPEDALQRMVTRFTGRFMAMEAAATKPLRELTAEEWDELWNRAKSPSG